MTFSRASATKTRGRPRGALAEKTVTIRNEIVALTAEYEVMTVRQVFYQLVARGIVAKERGYRPVQQQVLNLRREGVLPWEFIGDGTRFAHAPETWDSTEDALLQTAQQYRRNLWRSQGVRIEVWLEKDALASLISPTTYSWGVRLMVSRGQASDTFCYFAAQDARRAWERAGIQTVVYALYDYDESGRDCAAKVEKKLRTYSDYAPIYFELLAVTVEQIEAWGLPTRPANEKEGGYAVDLDAIPPDRLITLVQDAIIRWIDADAWEKEKAVEQSERLILERIAGGSA